MTTTLNVGLNVGDKLGLHPLAVLRAIRHAGGLPVRATVHESDTEQTAVVALAKPLSPSALERLSSALRQDAVAQWDGVKGLLVGPKAAEWGPFNPAFFLTLDGSRLAPEMARAA